MLCLVPRNQYVTTLFQSGQLGGIIATHERIGTGTARLLTVAHKKPAKAAGGVAELARRKNRVATVATLTPQPNNDARVGLCGGIKR